MKVVVHSGAAEIGGTCLEVASATTRIILDCGWPLNGGHTAVPPAVPGLFAPGQPPDAVFLTHAHPDHTGFIPRIPESVPIRATVPTSKIMLVGSIYAQGVSIPRDRFKPIPFLNSGRAGKPIWVGDLQVTAYPVDHSAFGAVALLVEHEGKRLFYTGDLRFHGRKPGRRERMIGELSSRLDALVIEGTNFGRQGTGLPSEDAVEALARETARVAPSLVMVAFSPQNIDRFVSFFRAAKASGRTFVCDHYTAAVLYMLSVRSLPAPSPHGLLRVYFPSRRKRIEKFESRARSAAITLEEIRATPRKFMMLMRPSLMNDFDDQVPAESRLLYGMWSGYQAEAKCQRMVERIESSGGEIIDCHASGHAHPDDLSKFIQELDPCLLVPVHTTHREAFLQLGIPVTPSESKMFVL